MGSPLALPRYQPGPLQVCRRKQSRCHRGNEDTGPPAMSPRKSTIRRRHPLSAETPRSMSFATSIPITRVPLRKSNQSCSFRNLRLGGVLMLRMDDMNAGLARREPLNVTAEPGRDLLETDILDVTTSVRAKNRCTASRLETAGTTFLSFVKLLGPLLYHSPYLL